MTDGYTLELIIPLLVFNAAISGHKPSWEMQSGHK